MIWGRKQENDKAIADLNEAIRLDPHDAQAYADRGAAWGAKGQLDRALADLNEAIRLEPENDGAYTNRAHVWLSRREFDKAIADLNTLIGLVPDDATAYNNRAGIWFEKKAYDKAIVNACEAIRLEPRHAGFRFNRSRAFLKSGRYDMAIADLNEAIRLEGGNAWSHNSLAWVRATCPDAKYRDGKRAVESATRACELTGWKEAYMLGTLAAAYAESGEFDAAVKWQTKANAMYSADKDRTEGAAQLKLYQARTPYRENSP